MVTQTHDKQKTHSCTITSISSEHPGSLYFASKKTGRVTLHVYTRFDKVDDVLLENNTGRKIEILFHQLQVSTIMIFGAQHLYGLVV